MTNKQAHTFARGLLFLASLLRVNIHTHAQHGDGVCRAQPQRPLLPDRQLSAMGVAGTLSLSCRTQTLVFRMKL